MSEQTFTRADGTKFTLSELTKQVSEGSSGKSSPQSMTNTDLAINLARAIGQGLMFGFADEAEGFARGVLGGQGYEKIRDEARTGLEQFREEMPLAAYGSEIVASIPSAVVGGGALTAARLAGKIPQALAGKIPQAAAMGAAYGAGTAEEVSDVPKSAAGGAVLGAGFQKIAPVVTEPARKLLDRGIPLTLGQSIGGGLKRLEEGVSSIPLAGDVIRSARTRASEGFNTEVINEVLKPLGQSIPKGTIGTEAFELANEAIAKQYEKVIPKIGVDFNVAADSLVSKFANQLRPEELKSLKRIVVNELTDRVSGGKLTGQAFKDAQSAIRKKAYEFSTSTSAYEKELGSALNDISFEITRSLSKTSPNLARELAKADEAYSKLIPVRRAVVKAEKEEGVFTPAQLSTSIAQEAKRQQSKLALGQVPLQDLARAGRATLPSVLPDSGTATRGIVANALMSGAGGATFGMPLESALIGGGLSALYTRPAQAFLRGGNNIRGVVPAASRVMRQPATAGLLAQEIPSLTSSAEAGQIDTPLRLSTGAMPVQEVYTTPNGLRYAITEQGATLLGE